MKSAIGNFLIQTTDVVTDTIAVTGVGFTPKALILFWTGRDDAVDSLSRADGHIGFSVCTATTERRVTAGKNEDAQATTDTDRYGLATAVVANISETVSVSAGLADLDSFDADGFTIVIDEVFGRNLRVSFLALGGDDITDQVVQDFVSQNSLGLQAVTGVGFQPDFLIWHALGSGTALPIGPGGNLQLTIAGMISAAQQGNWGAQARSGQGTSDANRHAENIEAFMTVGSGGGVNNRFEFDSMDADGFTVNHTEADDDRVNFLAMQGGDYAIGQLLTRTDGADIVVSGLGFKPAAVLFVSHNGAEDAVNVSQTDGVMSVGVAISPTEREVQGYWSVDGLGTSRVATAIEFDAVYFRAVKAASPTIDGLMDLKSMDADGFTCVMDNPDPSAAFVLFFAFGPAEAEDVPSGKWRYARQGIPAQGGVRA